MHNRESRKLSEHDHHVFTIITDHLKMPSVNNAIHSHHTLNSLTEPEQLEIANIEQQVVNLTEKAGKSTGAEKKMLLQSALTHLDNIILKYPKHPNTYNNRAQVKREFLLNGGMSKNSNIVDDISKDLHMAISLAEEHGDSKDVLAQAYSQLGVLNLMQLDTNDKGMVLNWKVREEASTNLYKGGIHGNEVAKEAAKVINPYAQLCGSMVNEILKSDSTSHVDK